MIEKVMSIKKEVSKKWGVPVAEMEGKSRLKTIVRARHEAMYRIREETKFSYAEIGRFFGRRNHEAVIYAVSKIKKELA